MDVLIRGRISDDGRTITVAPGVELKPAQLDIATDVPAGLGLPLLLFFGCPQERDEFARQFADTLEVECRDF